MLSVFGNWIYIGLTAFGLGFLAKKFIEKFMDYSVQGLDSIIMSGLIMATVYAQIFSLFGPVGLWANLGLILATVVCCICFGKEMCNFLKKIRKETGLGYKIAVCAVGILWVYFTSRGYMMYDTDLYHAQSIRWLEEYGVVKGLGNLHGRFAYNSAFFPLSALYSMKFLLGQSLHAVNGFFAFLLSTLCIRVAEGFRKKKLRWSDFARVGAIYYLTIIADEVISPTSDYCIMCMLFYIVIKWMDELEEKQGNIIPYGLLCVVGAYAVTLKLTAGLILLFIIKPAYRLICEKKVKEICLFLCMGLLTVVPWVIRNVVISGYLVYPFPELDLFSFDWKMNPERIAIDATQIKVWGRGIYNSQLINMPVIQWFPQWMKGITTMEKLLVLVDLAALIVLAAWIVYSLVKKKWTNLEAMLVMVTTAACYLFWQLSAPLMRYGYADVLLLSTIVFGYIILNFKKDILIRLAFVAYGCYKLFIIGNLAWNERSLNYYLCQQDYTVYEVQEVPFGTESVFVPVYGDRTGYAYFPSIPILCDVELRGETFAEGFCFPYE